MNRLTCFTGMFIFALSPLPQPSTAVLEPFAPMILCIQVVLFRTQIFLRHDRSHSTIRSTQLAGCVSKVRKCISGASGAS